MEEYLTSLSFSDEPRLAGLVEAMRYSVLVGSWRVRPVLRVDVSNSFARDPAGVLPSATAIELMHTFSLVHDGLPAMDKDRTKRRRHAYHEEFGGATAILAGDGFFGESLTLVTAHQKGTAKQLLGVVRKLARVTGVEGIAGGIAGGMGIEVSQEAGCAVDPGALNAIYDRKTGALVEASARIGAILVGAASEERETISEYARQLSFCLRLVNVVLNATPATGGSGRDFESGTGKATFVGTCGLSGARRLAEKPCKAALEPLECIDRNTAGLVELAHLMFRGGW